MKEKEMPNKTMSLICLLACALLLAVGCDDEKGTCSAICIEEDKAPDAGRAREVCFLAASEGDCLGELKDQCDSDEGDELYLDTDDLPPFNPDCESCDADCVDYPMIGWAPNIYLYPEITTQVRVTLGLAQASDLLASIPEYGDGWDVTVEPSGLIDGLYDYLYYESRVDLHAQDAEGWAVPREDVFGFFGDTLAAYGFEENEIADFLAFWEPGLQKTACYLVYPQLDEQVSQMVGLTIDPAPDTVRRMWFVVEPRESCGELPAPAIEPFERKGFTAVEWGVVLQ
jgi:hypothetical protein